MTQSLATPSETAGPAPLAPLAPRPWLVGAGQVAAAELAALAVVLASGPRSAAGITVTALGALVALAALVRVHGRPAYRWPLVYLRHRARVRAVRDTAGRTDALDAVLPALEARVFTDRLGHRIGLVGDGSSWTALLTVTLPTGTGPAALETLLRTAMAAPDIRPAAVQLVSWSVPEMTDVQVVGPQVAQPGPRPGPQPPGAQFFSGGQPFRAVPPGQPLHTAQPVLGHLPPRPDSYHQSPTVPLPRTSVMAAANGLPPTGFPPPAMPGVSGAPGGSGRLSLGAKRTCWIAVRVRPRDCPHAVAARGGGEAGALRATAVAALRLARDLTEAGFPAEVYDETDVRAQLRVSLGSEPAAANAGYLAPRPAEAWRWWSTGMLRQYCYRPRRASDADRVLGRTASFPAVFTCTSLLLRRRRDGRLERRTLVRVGMPVGREPADVDRAVRRDLAAPLVRLDGEHGATLHATMPLAL